MSPRDAHRQHATRTRRNIHSGSRQDGAGGSGRMGRRLDARFRHRAECDRVPAIRRRCRGGDAACQRPRPAPRPVGWTHGIVGRRRGVQRRDRGVLRSHESRARLQCGGPHRPLRGGRGDADAAGVRGGTRPLLSGGFRVERVEPDRREHFDQRRWHQGDPLRVDAGLGRRADRRHRGGRCARVQQRPGEERHRL